MIGAYGFAGISSAGHARRSLGDCRRAVLFEWGYFHDHHNSFAGTAGSPSSRRTGLPGYLGNCHASAPRCWTIWASTCAPATDPLHLCRLRVPGSPATEETMASKLYETVPHRARAAGALQHRPRHRASFVRQRRDGFKRTGSHTTTPCCRADRAGLRRGGGWPGGLHRQDRRHLCQRGITKQVRDRSDQSCWDGTLEEVKATGDQTIVLHQLRRLRLLYGHRRDVRATPMRWSTSTPPAGAVRRLLGMATWWC